jgi:hypothetical protein
MPFVVEGIPERYKYCTGYDKAQDAALHHYNKNLVVTG